MNGFEKRTAEIKQRIRQATLDLLMTSDPKSLRISDIVQHAHVSQVTIYKHFESKENLIHETIQEWYIKMMEETEAYLTGDFSFQEKLSYILLQKKQSFEKFPMEKLNSLLSQDKTMSAFTERMYQESTLPLMLALIDQGKKEGMIHHTFSSPLIMFYMNLFMGQADAFTGLADSYADKNHFIDEVIQLFFYGVAGKPH
ncbi:TetR/AcrR family transcriptional regulator [Exiguobacterium sp. s193]|uniref:TetR/AcrR family transcriptional regulator n=1 Tax=Exiguobacterium sp. s193 TaxID=2751207 RepID=UPI001BE5F6EC|nr:TetR/AcrR family transcriptional regulator [Exiguobacterium sp. s193]